MNEDRIKNGTIFKNKKEYGNYCRNPKYNRIGRVFT